MGHFQENADERRMFDDATKALYGGNTMAHIAGTLSTWAATAPEQGSYGAVLKIMANECAMAALQDTTISREGE